MTGRTPRLLVLRSAEQIGIVTHPLRLEIVEALQLYGPDSIAGLARRLDRRANALTYHVRRLEQAGAVVRAGTRRAGRRDEAVYAVAAPRIALAAGVTSRPPPPSNAPRASPITGWRDHPVGTGAGGSGPSEEPDMDRMQAEQTALSQLDAGEYLLWSGAPDPGRQALHALPAML